MILRVAGQRTKRTPSNKQSFKIKWSTDFHMENIETSPLPHSKLTTDVEMKGKQ